MAQAMIAKQARQLLVGTVVMWDNNPDDLGTVREIAPGRFLVDWASGQRGWFRFADARKVSVR